VVKNPLDNTVRTAAGCMEWLGTRAFYGYGKTMFRGKTTTAHRKVWTLTYGEIPEGMCVLHKCDNPPCCNPDHLFLGTHADNARDREAKGRGGGKKNTVTHCKNGHEYTPENTYRYKRTKYCRICVRAKTQRYYRKRKSA
jgi:hypothetical protein